MTRWARCQRSDTLELVVVPAFAVVSAIGSAIPTLQLGYAEPVISDEVTEVALTDLENMPVGLDGRGYRLEDLDGEGLPGVLTEQAGTLYFEPPREFRRAVYVSPATSAGVAWC